MEKLNTKTNTIISINKFKELDDAQRTMSQDICTELENRKLCVSAEGSNAGLERQGERLMFIKMFSNDTDYKQVQLAYNPILPLSNYIGLIEYALANKKYSEHVAGAEEIFVHGLVQRHKSNELWFDGSMLMECGGDVMVDTSDIKNMEYNKEDSTLKVEENSGEILLVKFRNESITWLNEDVEGETGEELTLDFLKKVIDSYNSNQENWCWLGLINETILIKDKDSGNISELIALDDINKLTFKNGIVEMEINKDENGFTSYTIDKNGIEM